MPRVPVANETRNLLEHQVVGNKADDAVTSAGTTASLVAYIKGILGLVVRQGTLNGTAGIDISEAVYTGYVTLLTITPPSGGVVDEVVVDLDCNKATTGWDAISTAADTLDIAAFAKIDGTNSRHLLSAAQLTATGTGAHATAGVRMKIGAVAQAIEIKVKLSAERDDVEIPYLVTWRGKTAPTVTAVAIPEE